MKNGNLYQEVKTAKREYDIAWSKYSKIESEMKKELDKATKKIKGKYKSNLDKLEKEAVISTSKYCDIASVYHDYGSFFTRDITEAFAVLLSYIEGEKFIPYRNYENNKICESSIIIKEDITKKYDKIDYEIIDKLYKNGDLIMLDSEFSNTVDFYNYSGETNYSFGNFNYLYEFVNRLIQYRIDNDKYQPSKIKTEEIYSFICQFISTHPDLAFKNKNKRELMLNNQNKEETLIIQCKKLEKKLEK